jgi:hypothetical protein
MYRKQFIKCGRCYTTLRIYFIIDIFQVSPAFEGNSGNTPIWHINIHQNDRILSVIIPSFINLSIIILSIVILSIVILSIIILSIVILSIITMSFVIQNVVIPSVIFLSGSILSVASLSVVSLSVIMPCAIMLNVVAPTKRNGTNYLANNDRLPKFR